MRRNLASFGWTVVSRHCIGRQVEHASIWGPCRGRLCKHVGLQTLRVEIDRLVEPVVAFVAAFGTSSKKVVMMVRMINMMRMTLRGICRAKCLASVNAPVV